MLAELSKKAAKTLPQAERKRKAEVAKHRATPLVEALEAAEDWQVMEDWKQDETKILSQMEGGKSRLKVKAEGGNEGKNVIGRFVAGDLSDSRWVVLDVQSEMDAGARVALGVSTGEDWTYYESAPRYIRPGKNPMVAFNMEKETFKTRDTDWKYKTRPGGLEKVQAVYVVFYPISGGTLKLAQIKVAR